MFPGKYYQHVLVTPLIPYKGTNEPWREIWLKDETQQTTRAFKFRGNFFRLLDMAPGSSVSTASTGNHGLGLSTSAKILDLQAHVFVPVTTPRVKLQSILQTGAHIYQIDGDYDQCKCCAESFARATGATYIPSFDDLSIIKGHSSLFCELDQQHPQGFDVVFVPVGGGGLLAACIQHYYRKGTRIVGVELDSAPAMKLSLAAGDRILLPQVIGRAEGLLVRLVGTIPFKIARDAENLEIALVRDAAIRRAIQLLWRNNGIRAEGAGAAGLAAALEYPLSSLSQRVLCIVSGGNIDEDYLQEALEETNSSSQCQARL